MEKLISEELKDRHLLQEMRMASALERIADNLEKIIKRFSEQ